MSKKPIKAANERDQKSILKYTKVAVTECIIQSEEPSDTSALISTERCTELKDATSTPKRKRSLGNSPVNSEGNKPAKCINMSRTPEEKSSALNLTPAPQDNELDEDVSTLSPELAKLERILSRKQTASLEGIKNDIKLLLENEKLIKKQQDTIEELKE